MWWQREFKAGEVWEYATHTLFVVLSDRLWDIRPDSPDGDKDEMPVLFLQVARNVNYEPGCVANIHRCSEVSEHARRFE